MVCILNFIRTHIISREWIKPQNLFEITNPKRTINYMRKKLARFEYMLMVELRLILQN